ncbi:peptidoglycan DD-metalloendopeptidase family protein [Vacuolonema iberomarrocanum]|uniref:peptidoglycan DD-metalloendopeptidase family protein n=1 Tax=Vacuolonema iberomarrocanum TaxID=3454632 RepID=UPI0019ED2B30|nr:peptidoglycan DD-metalloendopeptidase family protein [filamentous cyanobacterium LEGE 07170]
MRRVVPQKIRSFADRSFPEGSLTDQCKPDLPSSGRRARTSVAMLGLALSMGASGFLLPRHEGRAVAAEPPTAASEAAAVPVGTSADLLNQQAAEGHQPSEIRRSAPWATSARNRSASQLLDSEASKGPIASPEEMNSAPGEGLRAERDRSLSRLRQHRNQLRQTLSPDGSIPPLQVDAVTSAPTKPVSSEETTTVYHVRPGDTLASIARTHGIEQQALVELNSLSDPHFLRVHQALTVPASAASTEEFVAAEVPAPTAAVTGVAQPESGQSVDALELLPDIDIQEPVISQPVAVEPDAASTEDVTPSSATASLPDEEMTPELQSVVHRITSGETLGAIARSYGVPKETLVSENEIHNPHLIIAGQELNIPVVSEADQEEPLTLAARLEQASTAQEVVPEVSGKAVGEQAAQADILPPAVPTAIRSLPEDELVTAFLLPDDFDMLPSELPQPDIEATVESEVVQPEIVEEGESVSSEAAVQLAKDDPHAAALMSQISGLQESQGDSRTEASSDAQQPVLMAAAGPQDIQIFDGDSAPATEADVLLSPEEFEERASERKVRSDAEELISAASTEVVDVTAEESVSVPAEPQTIAAAPLGSESYAPLLEPVAGRMVSPELPPLADADAFLPEGTNIFDGYIWPAQGVLTSGYGPRWGRMHRGIDIAAPVGTPIFSAAPGVIEFSGWNSGGYGYMVDIRHPDGSMTRYAHNSRLLVRVGQEVDQGEQIAEMGSTGRSTGPHVHFEIHLPSQGAVNPTSLLASR